jgi:hypothetical protein
MKPIKTMVWKAKASPGWFIRFPGRTPLYFHTFTEAQGILRAPEPWMVDESYYRATIQELSGGS